MDRPRHQQSDVSISILRPYLGWWWERWPFRVLRTDSSKSESGGMGRDWEDSTTNKSAQIRERWDTFVKYCAICAPASLIIQMDSQVTDRLPIARVARYVCGLKLILPRYLLKIGRDILECVSIRYQHALHWTLERKREHKPNQTKPRLSQSALPYTVWSTHMCTHSSSTFR